jgi:large subunit ribosomal protein L33
VDTVAYGGLFWRRSGGRSGVIDRRDVDIASSRRIGCHFTGSGWWREGGGKCRNDFSLLVFSTLASASPQEKPMPHVDRLDYTFALGASASRIDPGTDESSIFRHGFGTGTRTASAATIRRLFVEIAFRESPTVAKSKKKVETVFLVCEETGDYNYTIRRKSGGEKLKLSKYSPRLRKHTLHVEKKK